MLQSAEVRRLIFARGGAVCVPASPIQTVLQGKFVRENSVFCPPLRAKKTKTVSLVSTVSVKSAARRKTIAYAVGFARIRRVIPKTVVDVAPSALKMRVVAMVCASRQVSLSSLKRDSLTRRPKLGPNLHQNGPPNPKLKGAAKREIPARVMREALRQGGSGPAKMVWNFAKVADGWGIAQVMSCPKQRPVMAKTMIAMGKLTKP